MRRTPVFALLSTSGSAVAQPHCGDLDVIFVLDASKSIGPKGWQIDLSAAADIAGNFSFGCEDDPRGVQSEMGIVEFATNVTTPQGFTCKRNVFMKSLKDLKQPCNFHDSNCHAYTYTGDALAAAEAMFRASGRANSAKVVVLITDGVPCPTQPFPNEDTKCTNATGTECSCLRKLSGGRINTDPQPDAKQAAKASKASTAMQRDGITVVGVAVGKDIGKRGRRFLDGVVSAPASKYLFSPSSWTQLPELVKEIVASIPACPTPAPTPVPTPAPTPAPTPVPTKCSAEIDVLFALDASKSIGPKSWKIDLGAASQIAGNFTFGCKDDPKRGGAQSSMGIIKFATNVTIEQTLTCKKSEFETALRGLGEPCDIHNKSCKAFTMTGDALVQAQQVFQQAGRPNAARVLVLITDGVPCRQGATIPPYPGWDKLCTSSTGANCSCFRKLDVWDGKINTDPQPEALQATEAAAAAGQMKDAGITVVGVAVGGDFGPRGKAFMEGIVSTPASKYLFNPSSWSKLPRLVQAIVDSICPPSHEFP